MSLCFLLLCHLNEHHEGVSLWFIDRYSAIPELQKSPTKEMPLHCLNIGGKKKNHNAQALY